MSAREETFTEVVLTVRPGQERRFHLESKGEATVARVSLADRVWRGLVLLAVAAPIWGPLLGVAVRVWEKLQ